MEDNAKISINITYGTESGGLFSFENFEKFTIGKSKEADLTIDDPLMEPIHFTLEQIKKGVLLSDTSAMRGITLNGIRVKETIVKNQDEILAGFTYFKLHLIVDQIAEIRQIFHLTHFIESYQPLYALLDAARDRAILNCLEKFDAPFVSLFDGRRAEEYASAAPYLVRLDVKEPLIETLSTQGFGHSWGVYCVSPVPFEMLCKHLRNLLYANTPDGVLFFRFYDPRVLRKFLPHYDIEMAEQFFGPVEAFLVEAEDPETVLRFTLGENGVKCETILLSRVNPSGAQQSV